MQVLISELTHCTPNSYLFIAKSQVIRFHVRITEEKIFVLCNAGKLTE